jgi:hypothetical protein
VPTKMLATASVMHASIKVRPRWKEGKLLRCMVISSG